ncbi:MAG: hypothetical protein ACHBN1_35870 [Heteroscytonema crispum UTEX LB 1556]
MALPNVGEVSSIEAIAGDNTQHIQKALDAVAGGQPDANGFRGALLLKPGVYELQRDGANQQERGCIAGFG